MAEDVIFDAPVQADAGASRFRVVALQLHWENAAVTVKLREVDALGNLNNKVITIVYAGPDALDFMKSFNRMNFSAKSMHKRIIEKLQTMGYLGAGTISGTPD